MTNSKESLNDKPHRIAMVNGWKKELAENIRQVNALMERRKTLENCIKGMEANI